MPATYEPISTQTLGSSVETVTFSSIASTYTDLVVIVNSFASVASDMSMYFNGDTGANYSRTTLWGSGSTAGSLRGSSANFIYLTNYGSVRTDQGSSVHIVNIMNYANTTTYKTVLARANAAVSGVDATAGLWRSTSAITSVTFDLDSTRTFQTGSTFTLYGIKAA
jgi:hypothetical protein